MEEPCRGGSDRRRQRHLVFAFIAAFGLCGHAQESAPAAPTAPITESRQEALDAIPNALEAWLDALAQAESGNRERVVHRDRDGQLYYGCLQFQARTFRVYATKLHLLPLSSRSELMSRIFDCGFQKRLAAAMLLSDPNNWKHWRLTVEKKVGLPPMADGTTPDASASSQ